jgi:xanthine dehydrogenase accessory factor
MSTLYERLMLLLEEGTPVATATITSVKGSVPREVGAKMIIHPYGRHEGTIGGGCGEADVIRAAVDVLADGKARTVLVDLTEPLSLESQGVCGGTMSVFIERWAPLGETPGADGGA